jgi:hypothetical protein
LIIDASHFVESIDRERERERERDTHHTRHYK